LVVVLVVEVVVVDMAVLELLLGVMVEVVVVVDLEDSHLQHHIHILLEQHYL
jgi:hypothetical protein